MNTIFEIDGQTYNITHIGTKVLDCTHNYAAGRPFLQVWIQAGGARVVIFRAQYTSKELVVSSDAFIPNDFLDLVLKNTVRINTPEGQRLNSLERWMN